MGELVRDLQAFPYVKYDEDRGDARVERGSVLDWACWVFKYSWYHNKFLEAVWNRVSCGGWTVKEWNTVTHPKDPKGKMNFDTAPRSAVFTPLINVLMELEEASRKYSCPCYAS